MVRLGNCDIMDFPDYYHSAYEMRMIRIVHFKDAELTHTCSFGLLPDINSCVIYSSSNDHKSYYDINWSLDSERSISGVFYSTLVNYVQLI